MHGIVIAILPVLSADLSTKKVPMTRFPLVALAMLLGIGISPVQAQRAASLDVVPGTRVRVTAEAPGRTTGMLLALNGDDILIQPDRSGDTLHVALSTIRSLEVSRGAHRRRLLGGVLGYAGGLALGGLVGFLVLDAGQPSDSNLKGIGMALGGTVGAVAGIVTGIVVGSRPVERWRRVSLPADAA